MEIKVIRSANRKRTISGRGEAGLFVVRAPLGMSDAELAPIIEKLQARWQKRQDLDENGLQRRAQALNRMYFEGALRWESICWSTHQNSLWGSCTPGQRTIRISARLAKAPTFVLDYVIVHELAHLIEANHGPRFWSLVNRYPRTERARGYLMALGLEDLESET
jgi:predicted metal-dependent hydrolase